MQSLDQLMKVKVKSDLPCLWWGSQSELDSLSREVFPPKKFCVTLHQRRYYHYFPCERLWPLANLKNWSYLENAGQLIPHRVADSHEDRGVQWSNVQMIHLKKMINKLWGNNQKMFLTPNPAQERPPRPRASERNTVEVPLLMISAVSSMNTALIVLCVRVKKVRNWSLWLCQMVKSSIKEEEREGLDLLAEYVGKYLKPNMLENI